MAARTTRREARERMRAVFEKALDRVIPEDETRQLQGRTFREWEDQADAFDQAVVTTLLEERAALEESARVDADDLGRCPHCGSDRLYLQGADPKNREIRTPHGEAVLGRQSVRCRSCGRSFSPSGARLGPAGVGPAVAQGVSPGRAGGDVPAVRPGGQGAE